MIVEISNLTDGGSRLRRPNALSEYHQRMLRPAGMQAARAALGADFDWFTHAAPVEFMTHYKGPGWRRGNRRQRVCPMKCDRHSVIRAATLFVSPLFSSAHHCCSTRAGAPRFDLAFTMNDRRILIANLAKGTIGEQAANLLGSLLVSHLQLIAMERGALPPVQRVPFFAHVDEMQTLSSDAFASLLSESENSPSISVWQINSQISLRARFAPQ